MIAPLSEEKSDFGKDAKARTRSRGASMGSIVAWLGLMLLLLVPDYTLALSSEQIGQSSRVANMHRLRSIGVANRISELEVLSNPSKRETAELEGMLAKGDSYDVSQFSNDHLAFKREHNEILVKLHQWCGGGNVFVLDGSDANSCRYLMYVMAQYSAIVNGFFRTRSCLVDTTSHYPPPLITQPLYA